MERERKRKRASLSESGQLRRSGGVGADLVEQAASEMQQLKQHGNPQLDAYLRLHCRESLLAYLEECPLLQCCDAVTRLDSDEFVAPFVELAIKHTHPVHGVCFGLKTYLDALRALVSEAMTTAATREYGRGKPGALVLCVEEESLATMTAIARSNLLHSGQVTISDDRNMLALYNDRQLDYLSGYGECNLNRVKFFTLTLHGQLVQTMIVPPCEHQYELQLRANHHIRSYATLESELRDLRRQLAAQAKPVEAKSQSNELDEAKTQLAEAQQALAKQEAKITALERQAVGLKQLAQKAVEQAKSGKKAKKVNK